MSKIYDLAIGLKFIKNCLERNIYAEMDFDNGVIIRDAFSARAFESLNFINNEIPIKIYKAEGTFKISFQQLSSLKNCPEYVGWYFDCSHNNLTSLVGGPKFVDGGYDCSDNPLVTLEGCPEEIGSGDFNCSNTLIQNFDFFSNTKCSTDNKKGSYSFVSIISNYNLYLNSLRGLENKKIAFLHLECCPSLTSLKYMPSIERGLIIVGCPYINNIEEVEEKLFDIPITVVPDADYKIIKGNSISGVYNDILATSEELQREVLNYKEFKEYLFYLQCLIANEHVNLLNLAKKQSVGKYMHTI